MHVDQLIWSQANGGWSAQRRGRAPDLVLFFGARPLLASGERYADLRAQFPSAHILGCSTGGQIRNDDVSDDDITALTLSFDATPLRMVREQVAEGRTSRSSGESIGHRLAGPTLAAVFVLSDGLNTNGSDLVAGLRRTVGSGVTITGGLAGDGTAFEQTLVSSDCPPQSHLVAAVGFYGSAIRIGHGSGGDWTEFGPRRRITRAQGNVMFACDGEPALDLYEQYLGEEAKALPVAGLRFPFRIFNPDYPQHHIVRSIKAVDAAQRALVFAGDVPEGWTAQLMRGQFDRLEAGAARAAKDACRSLPTAGGSDRLALMISCVGRRTLMGQHVVGELEAAAAEMAPDLIRAGFYSYGEISPHDVSGLCELHNQTMTVTTLAEASRI